MTSPATEGEPLRLPQYMPSVACAHNQADDVPGQDMDGTQNTPAEVQPPGARPGTAPIGWALLPGASPGNSAVATLSGATPDTTAATLGAAPGATPGMPPIIEEYAIDPATEGVRRRLILDC